MRPRRLPAELGWFGLVTAFYLVYLFAVFSAGEARFYWDSFRYFAVDDPFGRDDGLWLPLVYKGLDSVASTIAMSASTTVDSILVNVTGALLAATLGVVVAPRLARALFPGAAISWTRVLALNALFFVFWRDYFGFPLSDFPALLLACVGLLGLLRATPFGYVAAGLGLMLAANMRPAYLPAVVGAAVLAGVVPRHGRALGRRLLAVGCVLAGALVVALPQTLVNYENYGSWNPIAADSRKISMLQLTQGMLNQKYETFVGSEDEFPRAPAFFRDPATAGVLADEGLKEITSYSQYAGIALRHPADMAASWTRHVFNGLDVRYPTPYIQDFDDSSVLRSLFLYSVLFVALGRLLIPDARRALGRISWAGVAVLVSPCISAIPGAVEPRFFLPLQLFAYMLVCFGPATRETVLGRSRARRIGVAACYVGFVLICLALSSATFAQLHYPRQTLGDFPLL